MGKATYEETLKNDNFKIVAGVDLKNINEFPFTIYNSIFDVKEKADVIIDFSNRSLIEDILTFASNNSLPLVECTTGFSSDEINKIKDSSDIIPIFKSGNMSVGINVLIELSKIASKIMGEDFEIEILETHHHSKLDAPSGTAIMIAEAIEKTLPYKPEYVYDRHNERKPREKNEIGIHSLRGGTVVGQHSVLFYGPNEEIKIEHIAESRSVFANGALKAASFIVNMSPGLYDMSDLINSMI